MNRFHVVLATVVLFGLSGCVSDEEHDKVKLSNANLSAVNAHLQQQIDELKEQVRLHQSPEAGLVEKINKMKAEHIKSLVDLANRYEDTVRQQAARIDAMGTDLVVPELKVLQERLQADRTSTANLNAAVLGLRQAIDKVRLERGIDGQCKCHP